MTPSDASIGGLVYPVANGKIRALKTFTTSGVDDIWIRRGDGQRADGAGRLAVKERMPDSAVIVRFPDATVVRGNIKDVGLRRNSGRGHGTASAEGSDHSPAQSRVQIGRKLLGGKGENSEKEKESAHGNRV